MPLAKAAHEIGLALFLARGSGGADLTTDIELGVGAASQDQSGKQTKRDAIFHEESLKNCDEIPTGQPLNEGQLHRVQL